MSNKPAVLRILVVAVLFSVAGCQELYEKAMGYHTPEWRAVATLGDGRQFVTDGTFALEVSIAELEEEELPDEESAAWFSDALYQNGLAERRELFGINDIDLEGKSLFVMGPGNMRLERYYINYLLNRYGSSYSIGFWQHSSMQPVVLVFNGNAAGAMKPFTQN